VKRPYQITALVLLGVAGYVLVSALEMRYYTPLGPGPGFFPFWLAIALGGLGLAMGYQATFRPADEMPEDFVASPKGYMRDGAIIVALIWAVVAMETLGFIVTMFVFFCFLLSTLGRQRIFVTVLVAIGGSFGANILFYELLNVPLPGGVFPLWWGG
jgi:putative tricarboxylic transport membrane protein